MHKTLGDIAKFVDGEIVGDASLVITGLSGIKEAKEGDLTFVANSKYFPLVPQTKASAVIAPRETPAGSKSLIRTDNPSLAFAKIASIMSEANAFRPSGIHPTAIIADNARLGKNVSVGPFTVIEHGARIGDNTVLFSHCYVGPHTTLGADCLIYSNVSIREKIAIGNRVIVHCGTVIGSDGFGFVNVKGVHVKIPQIGTVQIDDDVEIGANVTIDRARFEKTHIGQGTKIDNLVQIAHNVKIGKNCIIVSQVGISGSTTIEDDCVLAGQVGVAGHLTIGKGTVVASKSGVPSDISPGSFVWGIPAKPHMHAKRVNAALQHLPDYVKVIQDLKRRVAELEAKLIGRKKD